MLYSFTFNHLEAAISWLEQFRLAHWPMKKLCMFNRLNWLEQNRGFVFTILEFLSSLLSASRTPRRINRVLSSSDLVKFQFYILTSLSLGLQRTDPVGDHGGRSRRLENEAKDQKQAAAHSSARRLRSSLARNNFSTRAVFTLVRKLILNSTQEFQIFKKLNYAKVLIFLKLIYSTAHIQHFTVIKA